MTESADPDQLATRARTQAESITNLTKALARTDRPDYYDEKCWQHLRHNWTDELAWLTMEDRPTVSELTYGIRIRRVDHQVRETAHAIQARFQPGEIRIAEDRPRYHVGAETIECDQMWITLNLRDPNAFWGVSTKIAQAIRDPSLIDTVAPHPVHPITAEWFGTADSTRSTAATPARPHRCRVCGETWRGRFMNAGPENLCDDCQEDL